MESKRTSVYENSLIWFGAGVSIAEILTGTYLAPLGFQRGLAAIIIGHVIGCCMMFFAGLIGARMRKSAMETVKMSFGQKGGLLFAILNVLQLVGWTAIMIYDGALAANGIFHTGAWVWCLVIGALIVLWIAVGVTNLGKINTIAMAALFILTILLCRVIFFGGSDASVDLSSDAMSFGAAVELSVAMPLSWLPVISDYTREAEKPVKATSCKLLDVCDRHGSGDLYRRDRYRGDHGKGRSGNRGTSDRDLFHSHDHIPRRLFSRSVFGVDFLKTERKSCGHCGDSDRNDRCYYLPDG